MRYDSVKRTSRASCLEASREDRQKSLMTNDPKIVSGRKSSDICIHASSSEPTTPSEFVGSLGSIRVCQQAASGARAMWSSLVWGGLTVVVTVATIQTPFPRAISSAHLSLPSTTPVLVLLMLDAPRLSNASRRSLA